MRRLSVILLSIIVSNCVFGNSNAVITGTLGMRAIPCFGEGCPCVDVVKITNDTASFVLVKNGQYLWNFDEFGKEYYFGSVISIYGNIFENQEYNGQKIYELDITAILKDISSNNFSANCIGATSENQTTTPVIAIENDSVIIQHIIYENCCAEFALRISEVINDTLYVTFSDTEIEKCRCMCNYTVRIRAIKSVSQTLKVYYNGVVYDLNTSSVEQIDNQHIQILPNPTNGIIKIEGIDDYSNLFYEICNSIGQIIQSGNLKQTIDLSNSKGLNILTITKNQKIVARKKIIVK